MTIAQDVSVQLDSFTQNAGAILIRTVDGWAALEPGNPTDILIIDNDGNPQWSSSTVTPYTDTGWLPLNLLNGWSDFGSVYPAARVRRTVAGVVMLDGLIKPGTTTPGTILFVLPDGTQPDGAVMKSAINSSNGTQRLNINPNRNVTLSSMSGSYISINTCWQVEV